MNTKKKLSLLLIAILALALGLGTFALYSKTFTSDNNQVRAARFEVDSNGTLDGDTKFDLTDDPIYPGVELELYEFEIDKKGTEVPVKYEITVTPYGELFEPVEEGDSPVALTVLRKVGDEWVDIGGLDNVEIIPDEILEEFRIDLEWGHSDYDIEYQGKPGSVRINVVATQIDGDVEPVDPDDPEEPGDPDEPVVDATYYHERGATYITVNAKNIDGATHFAGTVTVDGKVHGSQGALLGESVLIYLRGEIEIDELTVYILDGPSRISNQTLWKGQIVPTFVSP